MFWFWSKKLLCALFKIPQFWYENITTILVQLTYHHNVVPYNITSLKVSWHNQNKLKGYFYTKQPKCIATISQAQISREQIENRQIT